MYCSTEDIYTSFGRERTTNIVTNANIVLEEQIKNACGEIDGYVSSGGYFVPIESPPVIIKSICVDLVILKLLTSAGINQDEFDKLLGKRIDKSYEFLKNIASGKFLLPQEKETSQASLRSVQFRTTSKINMRGRQ
ncbi:MAG: phage protein Gp36 family protein [Treponemataceae bacterium]